jgi:peptidoglycan hydrolase CwlO-like protein
VDYNFFLDQLTQARQKFALPPSVAVIEGGVSVDVDSVSYDFFKHEIIIKYAGCDENWQMKYEDLMNQFEELQKENHSLKNSFKILDNQFTTAEDKIEGYKEDLAEAYSKIEDLEVDFEDAQEEIKKLKSEIQTLRNI